MSESTSSFEKSPVESDLDYEPGTSASRPARSGKSSQKGRGSRGRRQGATTSRPRPAATAPTSTSAGGRRPRAPRTRGRLLADLTQEDFTRVQELQKKRKEIEKARIQSLNLEECQRLLEKVLDREPSLIFDILSATPDPPAPEPLPPQTPGWCVCSHCKHMPTLLEQKCCQQTPQNCISRLPHMDLYILNGANLRLARRIWNDLRADVDADEIGESNKQFRYAAYRNFVVWQYGILGPGNRVVLPSCCVMRVRDVYPDPNGVYVGFIPSRV